MTTRLAGGRVYDPLNGIDGQVMDLWVRDGRIVAPPADGRADEVIDLAGKVVLPGGSTCTATSAAARSTSPA